MHSANVKLSQTGSLVVMALLPFEGAQPEEVSWIRKSADMLHRVTCHTVKLTLPLVACFVQIAQQKKSQTKGISCRR